MDSGKIPYPKSVFFIITNEFCERFSYYGMKAVLTLYLKNVLEYTEKKATVIYHVFSMLCYFTPIFGAMLADSILGKFKTILYLSLLYAVGNVVLSLAATTPLQIPMQEFSILGLLLIAIGTGGIKPCVSAFGGDQFTLPQQAVQLASFFSIFYFAINAGSLLSTFITPIFRKDIQCFGADTCYPLAFGVPAVLMVVSLIVFVIGYRWYTINKPSGNITAEVFKCISHALSEKSKSNVQRDHWLDYASPKYDHELISSVKQLLKILVLYIPLPVFWALFDQQGSRWTFQATRMNGEFFGWTIKPDQMQVLNPLLILALIPIFDQGIYPALEKFGILRKPLQRLTLGGILAGAAFVISGFLEIKLETTYAVKLDVNEAHLNFINDLNCTIQMRIGDKRHDIAGLDQYIIERIESKEYKASFTLSGEQCNTFQPKVLEKTITANLARSFFISGNESNWSIQPFDHKDILEKDGEGSSLIKFVFVGFDPEEKGQVEFRKDADVLNIYEILEEEVEGKRAKPKKVSGIPVGGFDSAVYKVDPTELSVFIHTEPVEVKDISRANTRVNTIHPKQGGNYVYILKKGSDRIDQFTITQPNSVHIFWLIPQYFVITVAEVMFSVTGLQFSFSQAPLSMKSVLQAAWLLTVAFGNVIVVFIAELNFFENQWKEFFLYAALMFVDMIIFAILAYFYVPIEPTKEKDDMASPNTVEMKENKRGIDYNNEI